MCQFLRKNRKLRAAIKYFSKMRVNKYSSHTFNKNGGSLSEDLLTPTNTCYQNLEYPTRRNGVIRN